MVTAAIKRCLLLGRSLSFYLPLSMGTIISTTLKGIPFCPGPQFSSVAQSCPTFCNPWTAALQAYLSITNSWSLLRLNKPRQHIKKQRHYFANKGPSSQSYGFPSSHVWMWELDYKESWALKIWCFWTVVLEKTLESPLDCKEIQPVHPKGNQSWIFIGRTDAEAETPTLWPHDVKSWLIGKDWRQKQKGMTEDEMVGWHHRLSGHEFE